MLPLPFVPATWIMLSLSMSAAWRGQRHFRHHMGIGTAYRVSYLAQPLPHTQYTRCPLDTGRAIAVR